MSSTKVTLNILRYFCVFCKKSSGHKVLVVLLPILPKTIVNNSGCLRQHKENSSFVRIQLMPEKSLKDLK